MANWYEVNVNGNQYDVTSDLKEAVEIREEVVDIKGWADYIVNADDLEEVDDYLDKWDKQVTIKQVA